MKRTALAALPLVLLAACGSESVGSAGDPAATPTPTAKPTVGTYPAFPHDDYVFTVEVGCFCPVRGPIRITVTDGVATDATWVRHKGNEGQHVPDYWSSLTLATVIDAANDTDAARVDVKWPVDQDYPNSVWVDRDERMVDEEIGYTISNVVVS